MGVEIANNEERLENAERERENPWIVFVVGNRGSGKSRLAKQIAKSSQDDVVLINADEVHSSVLGIDEVLKQACDNKKIVFPQYVQAEGTKRVNKLLLDSIEQRKNIILDASFGRNSFKFMEQLRAIGYDVEVQGMVINKYQAAYNVERRTLNFLDECMDIKGGKKEVPIHFNAMDVGYQTPLVMDDKIVDIIEEAEDRGVKLSLFEFGKENVCYNSDNKNKTLETGVDFYYDHQDTDYVLLHSNLLKLNKRCEEYGRDIAPLIKEVSILAKEQKEISSKIKDKIDGR